MAPQADIQSFRHTLRLGRKATAVRPLRADILRRIAFLDVSLAIKNPDGFVDIDQIFRAETFKNQTIADRAAAFDVLRSILINEALTFTCRDSPTSIIVLFKEGDGVSGVL